MKEGATSRKRVGAAGVQRRFEGVLREEMLWLALHAQAGDQVLSGLRVSS
jgi:hypothetical protein